MENWTEYQRNEFHNLEKLALRQQQDYDNCGKVLKKEVRKNSNRGNSVKIILIILGALVANKGIINQLMVTTKQIKY